MGNGGDDEAVGERLFGGFEEGVHGGGGHSLDIFDEDEFFIGKAGLLHSEVEFADPVVGLFGAVREFDFFIIVIEFYGDSMEFSTLLGMILEVEQVAISVVSEDLCDDLLGMSRFSHSIWSDEEKKLHS